MLLPNFDIGLKVSEQEEHSIAMCHKETGLHLPLRASKNGKGVLNGTPLVGFDCHYRYVACSIVVSNKILPCLFFMLT